LVEIRQAIATGPPDRYTFQRIESLQDRVGHQDLSTVCGRHDSSRLVNRESHVVVVTRRDKAAMDADANADVAAEGPLG
jgi:hypothetical protein